MKVFY